MDLFSSNTTPVALPLVGANAAYYPEFLPPNLAKRYFDSILDKTPWRQDQIKVFGKEYAQPRLTALYGVNNKPYTYSGIQMNPIKFTPDLLEIKTRIETVVKIKFTTVLLNLYRDGSDSNGWHSDNEKELGTNPVIASLSLGATRRFRFREIANHSNTYGMDLVAGSLLLMQGKTQHLWQHQIPKTKKQVGPRINLTFRVLN